MIDIHTHIIPNIDDGAETFSEALQLINLLENYGTRTVVLTPHYPNLIFGKNKTKEEYINKIKNFINLPQIKESPIRFCIGAEVFCGEDIEKLIENNEIITLNNSRYVLVEFSVTREFSFISQVIQSLKYAGYIPVIAHTERYICIEEMPSLVKKLWDEGCIIQINADSVLGKGPGEYIQTARYILQNHLADVIASDTHWLYERSPDLGEAHSVICLNYSFNYAEELFFTNPELIINNKTITRGNE